MMPYENNSGSLSKHCAGLTGGYKKAELQSWDAADGETFIWGLKDTDTIKIKAKEFVEVQKSTL